MLRTDFAGATLSNSTLTFRSLFKLCIHDFSECFKILPLAVPVLYATSCRSVAVLFLSQQTTVESSKIITASFSMFLMLKILLCKYRAPLQFRNIVHFVLGFTSFSRIIMCHRCFIRCSNYPLDAKMARPQDFLMLACVECNDEFFAL